MNYIVALTGASGAIYGLKLIEELLKCQMSDLPDGRQGVRCQITVLATSAAELVLKEEHGIVISGSEEDKKKQFQAIFNSNDIRYFKENNLLAPICSGSVKAKAMIVIPCSMATLASISNGNSANLIERTADVCLKERRKLIIVPRETPFNNIHLENMLRLSNAGAIILPAMPAFYNKPKTVDDMVNFVVGKVLDMLDIEHELFNRWK